MTEPPVDVAGIRELVISTLSAVAASAVTAMALVRRYSKLRVTTKQDRDEEKTIDARAARIIKLEADIQVMAKERNAAVSALGGLEERAKTLNELLKMMREERAADALNLRQSLEAREKRVDAMQRLLEKKIDENTELTKTGIQVAQEAFIEANNVNTKIREVGLVVADGSALSTRGDREHHK